MLAVLGIPARETVGYVPGLLQPHHRPLRRPGQGRPRLGAGVVPGLRLAELRPDRRWSPWPTPRRGRCWPTATGPSLAQLPVDPHRPRRGASSASWSWSGGAGAGGRPPGPTRSPPTSSGVGPARGGGGAPTRRSPPTASGWPLATTVLGTGLIGAGRGWWSDRPTGASSPRPSRSPPPWPSPAVRYRRGHGPGPASGRAGPATVVRTGPRASASSKEAPAASRGR